MGIIIALLALLAVGIIILAVSYSSCNSWSDILWIVMLIGGILLLVACVALVCNRAETRSWALGFEQTRITIEGARSDEGISEYEIAALQHKIIDYNARLAMDQYWQKNRWISWFIPAWIQELEPLR